MAPLMREPGRPTSIGFDYERYDELPHAQRIADQFQHDHLAHVVRADASSGPPGADRLHSTSRSAAPP